MKSDSKEDVSVYNIVAYSLPVGVVAFLLIPPMTLIPDIYPRFYGLKFSAIASASLIVGIVSAIANPIIGLLSDRYRATGGSRRSWVIAGLILFVCSSYELLVPPAHLSVPYFTFWFCAVIVSWIFFDLPHLAWGGELAHNYHARTHLFGIRCFVVSFGAAAFYLVPLLQGLGTTRITPESLKRAAEIGFACTLPAIFCAVRYVPGGVFRQSDEAETIRDSIKVIFSNRPFLLLVAICVFLGIGQGMWLSLSSVIFDYYYGVGTKLSIMYLVSSLLTSLSLPLLIRLSTLIGKKYTFACVQIAFVALIVVPLCLKPGTNAYIPLMAVLVGVNVVVIFNNVITNAILTDTVDYGLLRYGKGRGASYFAAFNFLTAIFGCIAGPIGLRIIEQFGFEPHGISDMGRARSAIDLAFFAIPVAMTCLGIGLIFQIPICGRRAESIRRRLEARSRLSSVSESKA